mgnify:CR=1
KDWKLCPVCGSPYGDESEISFLYNALLSLSDSEINNLSLFFKNFENMRENLPNRSPYTDLEKPQTKNRVWGKLVDEDGE